MKVIQLRRHMLRPSWSEWRASLIPTLLYMRSEREEVGSITSLSHWPVSFSISSGEEPSQGWAEGSLGLVPARSCKWPTISLTTSR